jgi:hypothetical protein
VTCEELRRDAAGLAAMSAGDPERDAAFAHAAACPGCAAALREGERLVALLEALPAPAPDAAALSRAAAPVLEHLPPVRPGLLLPAAAGVAAFAAAVASRPAPEPDWIAAAALAVAAAGIAALAPRGIPALALAVAGSLLFAVAGGGAGPLSAAEGLKCLAVELATAAVPLVALLSVSRGGAASPARFAAAAAAGALAGQAALEIACHAPEAAAHLLAFHAGGVLVAAAMGALVGSRVRARAAAA